MLKAKFKCQQVNKFEYGQQAHLQAVYGTGEENKSYSTATPSGKLELTINNPNAFDFFKPGGEYYLNITEATPPPPPKPV